MATQVLEFHDIVCTSMHSSVQARCAGNDIGVKKAFQTYMVATNSENIARHSLGARCTLNKNASSATRCAACVLDRVLVVTERFA